MCHMFIAIHRQEEEALSHVLRVRARGCHSCVGTCSFSLAPGSMQPCNTWHSGCSVTFLTQAG